MLRKMFLSARPGWWAGLALAEMAFLFWTSHQTWEDVGPDLPGFGNLLHLVTYFGLGGLWWLGLGGAARPEAAGIAWAAAAIAVTFGLSDEIHQHFIEGRSCSLVDLLVDGCGAAAAVIGGRVVVSRRWERRAVALTVSLLVIGALLAVFGADAAPAFDGWLDRRLGS